MACFPYCGSVSHQCYRKKKKAQQEKRKIQERLRLKMVLPGDTKDIQADQEIFSLENIKSKKVGSMFCFGVAVVVVQIYDVLSIYL